jgi:hypothetical protein
MIPVYSAIDTIISARSIETLHQNTNPTHQVYPPDSPTSLTTPCAISNPTRQLRNAHLSHLSGTLRSRRRLSEAKPRFQLVVRWSCVLYNRDFGSAWRFWCVLSWQDRFFVAGDSREVIRGAATAKGVGDPSIARWLAGAIATTVESNT